METNKTAARNMSFFIGNLLSRSYRCARQGLRSETAFASEVCGSTGGSRRAPLCSHACCLSEEPQLSCAGRASFPHGDVVRNVQREVERRHGPVEVDFVRAHRQGREHHINSVVQPREVSSAWIRSLSHRIEQVVVWNREDEGRRLDAEVLLQARNLCPINVEGKIGC